MWRVFRWPIPRWLTTCVIRLAVDVSQLTDVILVAQPGYRRCAASCEAEAERATYQTDKYVPDCSLYRLIPYFGPVADFSVRQPVDQYLPLPVWSISASSSCCRSTLRRLQCCFLALSMSVAMDLGDGGGGDQYDRYASGRLCLRRPLLQSVCGKDGDSGGWYSFFDPVGAGRISALPGSDGRGTPLPVFHVGVPVLGAVVPYARPTGREQCCYGGLHLAALRGMFTTKLTVRHMSYGGEGVRPDAGAAGGRADRFRRNRRAACLYSAHRFSKYEELARGNALRYVVQYPSARRGVRPQRRISGTEPRVLRPDGDLSARWIGQGFDTTLFMCEVAGTFARRACNGSWPMPVMRPRAPRMVMNYMSKEDKLRFDECNFARLLYRLPDRPAVSS